MQYQDFYKLVTQLYENNSIHIECNQETCKEFLPILQALKNQYDIAYILQTDKGYERHKVKQYLQFYASLLNQKEQLLTIYRQFELEDILHKKLRDLDAGQLKLVQFARASLQHAQYYYIENPLGDLSNHGLRLVLKWMEEKQENGISFLTAANSLRQVFLLKGKSFYLDKQLFQEIHQDDYNESDQEEFCVYKLYVKMQDRTILIDPKEVDYIESNGGISYMSVRQQLYASSLTLDELEQQLKRFGFFRCHRSYIVNVQKVDEIEKWTKNSYTLRLGNTSQTKIPLAKGRVDEMKQNFRL